MPVPSGPTAEQIVQGPKSLDITDLGIVVSEGTSKIIGSARLPDVFANRKTQAVKERDTGKAKVEVLDANLNPTGFNTETDFDGQFFLDLLPKNKSYLIKVASEVDGKTAVMREVAHPTNGKECLTVDLATTIVADKILSPPGGALFKEDAALHGAPLMELIKPDELAKMKATIRKCIVIEEEDHARVAEILTAPGPGAGNAAAKLTEEPLGAKLFDDLAKEVPALIEVYHQLVFERPEAELKFTIKATGLVRNKDRKKNRISGTFKLKLVDVKPKTKALEFWFNSSTTKKLGAATAANEWSVTIDTRKFPDGLYTMVSILDPEGGRKRALGSADIEIDNSFLSLCP